MPLTFLQGDLFLSRAQTLAHGANCRGRMHAGVAVEFRRRFPRMYKEYKRRCHSQLLLPGDYFLWKDNQPWILNLATQAETGGATQAFVRQCLVRLAGGYADEGITSIAMPRIAAGLGGLPWEDVRNLIVETLGELPIAVFVYEEYVEGHQGDEPGIDSALHEDESCKPVLFSGRRRGRWDAFSNFAKTPIVVDGSNYPTVEHYFQASKACTAASHEMIRTASTPKEAKRLGRRVELRADWESVKIAVMRRGLLAKFTQHPELRWLLRATGDRPIHEDSAHDAQWGWMNGTGKDLLGRLLVEIRATLQES